MKKFVLIIVLLNNGIVFGSTAKPPDTAPNSNKTTNTEWTFEALEKQMNSDFQDLKKEIEKNTVNTEALNKLLKSYNTNLYKARNIDFNKSKLFTERRNDLIKEIIDKEIDLLQATLDKTKQVENLSFDITIYNNILKAVEIFNYSIEILSLLNHFDKAREEKINAIMQQLITIVSKMLKIKLKSYSENETITRERLNNLTESVQGWIKSVDFLNKTRLMNPLLEVNNLEKELNEADKSAWKDDLSKAAKQFEQSINGLDLEKASIDNIKAMIKFTSAYQTKANNFLEFFPQYPATQFDNTINALKETIKYFSFSKLLKYLKNINQLFLQIRSLDLHKQLATINYAPHQKTWEQIKKNVQEVQALFGIAYDDLILLDKNNKALILNEYHEIAQNCRAILAQIEAMIKKTSTIYYQALPLDRLSIYSKLPNMYGRILGYYGAITRMLVDLKIIQLNAENVLKPFKKVHLELIQITNLMEKENAQMQAASESVVSVNETAAAGTMPATSAIAPLKPQKSPTKRKASTREGADNKKQKKEKQTASSSAAAAAGPAAQTRDVDEDDDGQSIPVAAEPLTIYELKTNNLDAKSKSGQ